MNIRKRNIENSRTKSASSLKNKKSIKNRGKKFANNHVSETGGPKVQSQQDMVIGSKTAGVPTFNQDFSGITKDISFKMEFYNWV